MLTGEALLIMLGFTLGMTATLKSQQKQPHTSPTPTVTRVFPQASEGTFLVTDVLDGHTIRLASGEKVRYHGIDAPELADRYGTRTYETNKAFTQNRTVRLELDKIKRDKYGRILAYVWVDDIMVNEQLIEDGLARVYTIDKEAKPKHTERLLAAQERAQIAKQGIWFTQILFFG